MHRHLNWFFRASNFILSTTIPNGSTGEPVSDDKILITLSEMNGWFNQLRWLFFPTFSGVWRCRKKMNNFVKKVVIFFSKNCVKDNGVQFDRFIRCKVFKSCFLISLHLTSWKIELALPWVRMKNAHFETCVWSS